MTGDPLPGHVITRVAEHAHVSQRIVSMVLAGRSSVAPGTRNRVIAAIAEVGCAQHPATDEAGLLGVLVDTDSGYDHSPMIRAISDAARNVGLSTMVIEPGDADRILGGTPAGLIRVTPTGLLPALATAAEPSWPAAAVTLDHRTGARLATRHLLDHGHRRIWHIGGPPECPISREREEGWRDALIEAGLEAPAAVRTTWSAAGGYAAGRALAGRPECRAIFAAGDQIALGVLRAMSEAGRTAPAEVSIVGFDDLPESEFFSPPLTTIRLDLAAAAQTAVGILLGTHSTEIIDPVLVRRKTVAGPAAGRATRTQQRRQTSAAGH